jgi:ABC-type glycerol-3-phosphate transport system permease component
VSPARDSKTDDRTPYSTGTVRAKGLGRTVIRFALLLIFACTMAVPFCWMIMASFKSSAELDAVNFMPQKWTLDNYAVVLNLKAPAGTNQQKLNLNFGKWYFNSLFIAGWVTFLQLVTSSMAAFAFSRIRWPGRDRVFLLYLGTMMIPGLVLIIPNYFVMFRFHLINSYLGLILPAAFTAFGTFLLRQFMLTLPASLDEAAEIDGASKWQIFMDVVLPLCRPALITLAIFSFLGTYGSFFWPLIMIKDEWLHTLPIGMLYFDSSYGQQTSLLMAAAVMNVLPPIVLFIALQKFLVRGIQFGTIRN